MFTEGEFASQFVDVNGTDVADLLLATSTGSVISGRIVLEGTSSAVKARDFVITPFPVDFDSAPLGGRRRAPRLTTTGLSKLAVLMACGAFVCTSIRSINLIASWLGCCANPVAPAAPEPILLPGHAQSG